MIKAIFQLKDGTIVDSFNVPKLPRARQFYNLPDRRAVPIPTNIQYEGTIPEPQYIRFKLIFDKGETLVYEEDGYAPTTIIAPVGVDL